MTITKEQLDEWQRACEAATEGPWTTSEDCNEQPTLWAGEADGDSWIALFPHQCVRSLLVEARANAEFCAIARTALPALLDEVRRLRKWFKIGEMVPRGEVVTFQLLLAAEAESDQLRAEVERLQAEIDEKWRPGYLAATEHGMPYVVVKLRAQLARAVDERDRLRERVRELKSLGAQEYEMYCERRVKLVAEREKLRTQLARAVEALRLAVAAYPDNAFLPQALRDLGVDQGGGE